MADFMLLSKSSRASLRRLFRIARLDVSGLLLPQGFFDTGQFVAVASDREEVVR